MIDQTKDFFEGLISACTADNTNGKGTRGPVQQLPGTMNVQHQQERPIQQAQEAVPHSSLPFKPQKHKAHKLQHHASQHKHRPHHSAFKPFMPLFCHCGQRVKWTPGSAYCGKDIKVGKRRHKLHLHKIQCCHCQKLFNFTLNTWQTDGTWLPSQRACPLCKAAFHCATARPAPNSTVGVH